MAASKLRFLYTSIGVSAMPKADKRDKILSIAQWLELFRKWEPLSLLRESNLFWRNTIHDDWTLVMPFEAIGWQPTADFSKGRNGQQLLPDMKYGAAFSVFFVLGNQASLTLVL